MIPARWALRLGLACFVGAAGAILADQFFEFTVVDAAHGWLAMAALLFAVTGFGFLLAAD